MIDIERQVYTRIADKIRTEFGDITIASELMDVPASFPFVSIVEEDNYTYVKTQDSKSNENHARVMYEINIYSNKASGKKTECKKIGNIIDDEMLRLGFTRISKMNLSNDTATIYRLVLRYVAVVSKENIIYGR